MIDERDLEQAERVLAPPEGSFDRFLRRRDRKRRNQRLITGVVGIVVALLSIAVLVRTFGQAERPADEPTRRDIFAQVHGWIVFGSGLGIEAIDPANPDERARLTAAANDRPLAWSPDGTRLLTWKVRPRSRSGLFVLQADGSKTRLTDPPVGKEHPIFTGGSFTPDGEQVVYGVFGQESHPLGKEHSAIFIVDAAGGRPRALIRGVDSSRDHFDVYTPTVSPDGSAVAFIKGGLDHDHSLWMMNIDGGEPHRFLDNDVIAGAAWIYRLAWSPDDTRIALEVSNLRDGQIVADIYTVNVDGSGFRLVIPGGATPYWSPDGSRIAYSRITYDGPLAIAWADGSHIEEFDHGESGPWNPLPRESG